VTTAAFAASYADVRAAAERLTGVAHRTPVITSRTLDERVGASVFLKCENLQRMGAFKFRGAYNTLAQLGPAERARGVVAFSSGNHAQGVALAARILGMHATIIMPEDAPAAKLDATRGYGAEVIRYDRYTVNRADVAATVMAERDAVLVPPFDHPHVIAGAGTAALELFEDAGPMDVLAVCLGGGGLLAGSCLAATGLAPACALYGVEPEAGDDWLRSWHANERVTIPVPQTIADGQQTQQPGALTWPIVRAHARGVVTVTDDELRETMRFAFERLKLVLEPSGASALAAVLFGKLDVRGKRVGVTLSGGNVDPLLFGAAIARENVPPAE
jgi:threonine dehydratase